MKKYLLPSGRLRNFSSSSSSREATRETWLAEIFVPRSYSVISLTLRVETPLTYISATASFRTFSERQPSPT